MDAQSLGVECASNTTGLWFACNCGGKATNCFKKKVAEREFSPCARVVEPEDISALEASDLRHADFANSVIGTPEEIERILNITSISVLRLRSTGVLELPSSIICNTSLRRLDVSYNSLTDADAERVSKNTTIRVLDMSGNYLGYEGFRHLSLNTSIQHLYLGTNPGVRKRAVDEDPLTFGASLLDVEDCGMHTEDMHAICKSSALTRLNVAGNPLRGEDINRLVLNTTLTYLNASCCAIGEREALENIVLNTTLKTLDISYCSAGTPAMKSIAANTTLVYLSVSRNALSMEACDALFSSVSLRFLDISGCGLCVGGIGWLKGLKDNNTLTELDISNNVLLMGVELNYVSANESITSLSLRDGNLMEDGIQALMQNTTITELDVAYTAVWPASSRWVAKQEAGCINHADDIPDLASTLHRNRANMNKLKAYYMTATAILFGAIFNRCKRHRN